MTRASLRPVCKTTTWSRNLNKKEGVHSLTPFIHQFWARYQAYLWGTNTQSVEVICKGIWGNLEEQTAFLYRQWAQNLLSKNRATTRITPFLIYFATEARIRAASPQRRLTGQTGGKNVCHTCGLSQEGTKWQAIVHEPSKLRLHWRAYVSFGFEIVQFIKSWYIVSGAAKRL